MTRGKVIILRVKNPKTKLQKIREKQTISLYVNEILQKKKLNWRRGKDNVKAEKIFKRYVYRRKIANLQKIKVQLRRGKVKMKYVLLPKKAKEWKTSQKEEK